MPADDAPIGPSSDEEAAFLAGEGGGGSVPLVAISTPEVEDDRGELPPMEDLITRIPGAARELIEELFRARFITVKRIPKSALKNQ
ncbi:MAG: hypothetical protein ABI273_14605 [Lacunisphaera sp.]